MARLLLLIQLLFVSNFAFSQVLEDKVFFENTKEFMLRYTRGDRVAYTKVKESTGLLDSLIHHIANFNASGKSDNHLKAFYINAYNLLVIKQVVDNLPLKSPMDVKGFFSETVFNVGGENMTLDFLEHEYLVKKLKDERVHFALACASESCPLMDAYEPNQIDLELNVAKEQFMSMSKHVLVSRDKILISKIFDWYKDEFINASFRKSLRHYINTGRDTELPKERPIEFKNYDWSLNDI